MQASHVGGWLGRAALLLALFLSSACSKVPMAASAPPAGGLGYREITPQGVDDPLNARLFELDNGMRVYLTANPESPRFYAQVSTRAGGKNDPATNTGLAHYLEHLLFKGTSRLGTVDAAAEKVHIERIAELYDLHYEAAPGDRAAIYEQINAESALAAQYAIPNELDKIYKELGATGVNAYTSNEETTYLVDLPANRLEQWAVLEAERFSDPVMRLFITELEVVYEEKNRSLDNGDRLIGEALAAQLYKVHPYGQQTILGSTEHLRTPRISTIREFFDRYYVPNNMVIVASGDIDIDASIEVIAREFNRLERGPDVVQPTWDDPPPSGRELVEVTYPGEEAVHVAFRAPAHSHEDAPAMEVLDALLSNGTAGLIGLNLVGAQKIREGGSYLGLQSDYGDMTLYATPNPGQPLEEVEQLLLSQLDLLKQGQFEEWLLDAIKSDQEKREKQRREGNGGRVGPLRESFILGYEWDDYLARERARQAVTKGDVVRVANKYFGGDYVVAFRHDGPREPVTMEKPVIQTVSIDQSRQSPFATELLAMQVEPVEPAFVVEGRDYVELVACPARTIVVSANRVNDLFSMTLVFEKGSEHDKLLPVAQELLGLCGAGALTREQLRQEIMRLGLDLRFSVGANTSTVTISGIDRRFEESLALLATVLSSSDAPEGALEQLKQNLLARRAEQMKNPAQIAAALTSYQRYGDRSPYLDRLTEAQVRALTEDELLGAASALLEMEHTVEYVGIRSPEEVDKLLATYLPAAADPVPAPAPIVRPMLSPAATEILLVDQPTAQSQVNIVTAAAPYQEALTAPATLYNNYFAGGMSGIVFQELREARALAYTARASFDLGSRPGEPSAMTGYIGTQVDKTTDAVTAFLDLWENLPVSQERLDRTITSLDNQFRTQKLGFRSVPASLRRWREAGLPGDPRPARHAALMSSGMQTLLDFHRQEVAGRPKQIGIVGDRRFIDVAALEAIAPVREVAVEQLFTP